MPRVSVHIVTYNNQDTIIHTLDSLFQQHYQDYSVLVVDNASIDNTIVHCQEFPLRLYQNSDNVGYAVAHNQALALTDSDYVLTLNPDMFLHPDFIAEMVRVLDSNPQLGSAAGCLLRVNALDEVPRTVDSTGLHMSRTRRQRLRNETKLSIYKPVEAALIFGPDGAAAFYRRAMLEHIAIEGEVFDSDFFIHKEDVDVCWRAQLYGWKSVYVPTAFAKHIRFFRPGRRKDIPCHIRIMALRNRYFLMFKNELASHFLSDFIYIIGYDLGILAYVILREPRLLAAYVEVVRKMPRMLAKRRIIAQHRLANAKTMRQWFLS